MPFSDFMSKVRQWDNAVGRWLLRHYYFIFFEFVLVALFLVFFVNTLKVLDLNDMASGSSLTDRLMAQQSINTLLVIALLLLNSFWMLYMFNSVERMRGLLKDISYSLMRQKTKLP